MSRAIYKTSRATMLKSMKKYERPARPDERQAQRERKHGKKR